MAIKKEIFCYVCVSVDLENREQWCAEPAWLVNAIRTAGDSRPYLRRLLVLFAGFCYCSSQARLKRAIQSLFESR